MVMSSNAVFDAGSPFKDPQQASPAENWHSRYEAASRKYGAMEFSPELMDALANGLRCWASMLPQVEVNRLGQHKPANSWGLSAEMTLLWRVEVVLEMGGETRLSEQIKKMGQHLYKTAEALDDCYPKLSADEQEAERRLVLHCQCLTHCLVDLLGRMKYTIFGVRPKANPWPRLHAAKFPSYESGAKPKRATRAAAIEKLRCELIEHIKAAKDHAHAALEHDREPELLARPTRAELGRRAGLARHSVTRCFNDSTAKELRLLWQLAGDLESILRYSK